MVSGISNVAQTQPVAQPKETATEKPAQAKSKPAPADSVQLSKTAQAMATALQEARETSFQTAQEAGKGDRQAQRLLAKEAAAKPATK